MNKTDVYFDFEFIDDGKSITPISLGMVTNNGGSLYIEYEFDVTNANDWVAENVFPGLVNKPGAGATINEAKALIQHWVSENTHKPRFWGYYPSYDWVCLAQHFGTMMSLPDGWPMRPECLMQLVEYTGFDLREFKTKNGEGPHNAREDAKWNRLLHRAIKGI